MLSNWQLVQVPVIVRFFFSPSLQIDVNLRLSHFIDSQFHNPIQSNEMKISLDNDDECAHLQG